MKVTTQTWLPFDPCGPSVPIIPWQKSHKISVNNINNTQIVKKKQSKCLIIFSLHGHNFMKANKHHWNEDDVLVDLVHQTAPAAPQDPESPKDKTQQGQEPQWWWTKRRPAEFSEAKNSATWATENINQYNHDGEGEHLHHHHHRHHHHTNRTARCSAGMKLFLSASLFVGWPSHLFHSHICDLLGGDWYGNIIIPPWILSLFSLTLALSLPSISLITFATSPFLRRSCLSPPLCSSGSFPQPAPLLPYFNSPFMTRLTTLHFFLHWPIHLKERSCAEQQWNLLRERWKASRIQSKSPRRQDTQCLVYTLSIKCFTCHQPQMLSVVFFLGFQIYTVYWIISLFI